MRTVNKIIFLLIIGLITNVATLGFAAQTTAEGKVSKIRNNSIIIRTSMADSIPPGSRVDLFFEISEGQSIAVGQWKVTSSGNGEVFAEPIDVLGPPQEGMTAKITFTKRTTPVKIIKQDHHNAPPVLEKNSDQEDKSTQWSLEPELKGKEPEGQLLGIPFPKKSVNEYMDEGNKYYYAKQYQKSKKEFEQCASMGNAECKRMLGLFYNNGLGVKKDMNKARQYYEESAKQNNVRSIYNLGVMYTNGTGVEKNLKKGYELFLKSANMGYGEAQFNIGAIHYNGLGVKKDPATALKWFKKAADQNIPKALYVVGQGHEFGWGVSINLSKANEYYKKAADLGYQKAINKLKK